jgi:glutamate racemase
MLEKNIDTVVLGCTHYPFVIPLIEEIVGEGVRVIDPAPSVARQVRRLLETGGGKRPTGGVGSVRFFTSGDAETVQALLPVLLRETGQVQGVGWKNDLEIKMVG